MVQLKPRPKPQRTSVERPRRIMQTIHRLEKKQKLSRLDVSSSWTSTIKAVAGSVIRLERGERKQL